MLDARVSTGEIGQMDQFNPEKLNVRWSSHPSTRIRTYLMGQGFRKLHDKWVLGRKEEQGKPTPTEDASVAFAPWGLPTIHIDIHGSPFALQATEPFPPLRV